MKKISAFLVAIVALSAAEPQYVVEEVVYEPAPQSAPSAQLNSASIQEETEEYLIPNSPILQPTNIITVRSIGMGVAPENTISPAQALVLAKRAAIADGYRQLGEKMYGIRINAKDTIKDAVVQNTSVRTQVHAIIRNAEIVETVFKDGLCQVEMEVRLDGRRWYRVLSGF
jgi:hypothetical protein